MYWELDDNSAPHELALDSVRSMERSDQEERDGQAEGQQGEEDVGEVRHGEYCHCRDLKGVQDLGPVDQYGHDGHARVENDEAGETVRGQEITAAGSHDGVFVF